MNFFEKANIKHNYKYDYSLSIFTKMDSKIKIICPIHGEFEQTPKNHLRTCGCNDCSVTKKLTLNSFKEKANIVHEFKYNYDLVDKFKNNKDNIIIICPTHGNFSQRIDTHLHVSGCPECKKETLRALNKYNTEDIKNLFYKIHTDKYDYSLVEYKDYEEKISIMCKTHGVFYLEPHKHITGTGCRKCADDMRRKDLNTFLNDANKIHFNFYNYDKVNYINSKTKIEIICNKHGSFLQKPNSHLNGDGCPKCKMSLREREVYHYLTINNINFEYNKNFNDCKFKNKLYFDFYLNDLNTCIEVDGIQHFHSVEFFGGEKTLELQKIKDQIKTDYCATNNIKLIRIKYDEDVKIGFAKIIYR